MPHADTEERRAYHRAYIKTWRAQRKEALNAESRARHAANPEPRRNATRKWRAANPEQVQAKNAAYHASHPRDRSVYMGKRYEIEGESIRAKHKQARVDHPEKFRVIDHNHKVKRKFQMQAVAYERIDPQVVYARDHGICQLCQEPCTLEDASIDHVIPLSKGGPHTYANITLAHKRCNSRKGNRHS